MIGEAVAGNGERAYEYFCKIAPSFLEDESDLHRTEPYVYAQMIAGKDSWKPGEAKNSWLTGTAAWNFFAVSQYILGIQPDYDGLIVNPCIPKEWDGFQIVRKFRGTKYEIEILNSNHVSKGIKELWIDGKKSDDHKIPISNNEAVQVKIILG